MHGVLLKSYHQNLLIWGCVISIMILYIVSSFVENLFVINVKMFEALKD